MRVIDALRCSAGESIALVGAGGKTTALFFAARELNNTIKLAGGIKPVLVTTTTHLGTWQAGMADHFITVSSRRDVDQLALDQVSGVVLLAGEGDNQRLPGLPGESLYHLWEQAHRLHLSLLIETDGSALHPLKAPGRHEPVIPGFIDTVVVVAGLSGLGKPLTGEWVHRPDLFSRLSGVDLGDMITPQALGKVLLSEQGGLKAIPPRARRILLLNQADTPELQSQAMIIARKAIPGYHSVIIAAVKGLDNTLSEARADKQRGIHAAYERVGGIILAAGSASRYGSPKQVLLWNGSPLVRQVACVALEAGLAPVIVVAGAYAEEVTQAVSGLDVRIAMNPEWVKGLSTSIRTGVGALDSSAGGAVFLPADHPQVDPSLIRRLIETHQGSLSDIVAPMIAGQRGNPVLFDRRTFPALLSLSGDVGGRVLFDQFQVEWCAWDDESQLLDIDIPQDYQKLIDAYSKREVE